MQLTFQNYLRPTLSEMQLCYEEAHLRFVCPSSSVNKRRLPEEGSEHLTLFHLLQIHLRIMIAWTGTYQLNCTLEGKE